MTSDRIESPAPTRRRRRRRWPWVIGAALLFWVTLLLAGEALLSRALVLAVRRAAGWTVRVGSLRAGLRPPRVSLRDFTVANPEGFPQESALALREIYIEYGGAPARPRETVLRELRVDIGQVLFIRRADGWTNFDALTAALPDDKPALPIRPVPRPPDPPTPPSEERRPSAPTETPDPGPAPAEPAPRPPRPPARPTPSSRPAAPPRPAALPRTYRIERLTVKLGTVELRDATAGPDAPPILIEFNRTFVFTDVTDLQEVSNQLSLAMTLILAPRLFDQLLAPLFE